MSELNNPVSNDTIGSFSCKVIVPGDLSFKSCRIHFRFFDEAYTTSCRHLLPTQTHGHVRIFYMS